MNNNGNPPQYPQDNRNNQVSNPQLVDWSRGITLEQYQQNQARITELQRMNELGLRAYAQREYDIVQQGADAARRLQQLQQVTGRSLFITPSSEPVPPPPAMLGQQQQYGFQSQNVFSSTPQQGTTPMQGAYTNVGQSQQTNQFHAAAQAAYYRSHVSEQRPPSPPAPHRPTEAPTAPQFWSYGAQPQPQGQSSRAQPEQAHARAAYQAPPRPTTTHLPARLEMSPVLREMPQAKAATPQNQFLRTPAQSYQTGQPFTSKATPPPQQRASTSNVPGTTQQQASTAHAARTAQQQERTAGIHPVPEWAKDEYNKWVRLYGTKTADALMKEVYLKLQQRAAQQRAASAAAGNQSTPAKPSTAGVNVPPSRSSEPAPGPTTSQPPEVVIVPSEPSSTGQTRGTGTIPTSTVPATSASSTAQPQPPQSLYMPRPQQPAASANYIASSTGPSQSRQGPASGIDAAPALAATQSASMAKPQAPTPVSQPSATPTPIPKPVQPTPSNFVPGPQVRWQAPTGAQHYQGAYFQGGSAQASGLPHGYPTHPYGADLWPPFVAGPAPSMGQFVHYAPYGHQPPVPPPPQQGWRRSRPEPDQDQATAASTGSKPTTPVPKGTAPPGAAGIHTSPQSARKPTLARDILRSLGGMSSLQQSSKISGQKRKRTHEEAPVSEEPPAKMPTLDTLDAVLLESIINIPSDDETEPEKPAASLSPSVASKEATAEPPVLPHPARTPERSPFAASIASASPQAITTEGARMLAQQGPDSIPQPSVFAAPSNQAMPTADVPPSFCAVCASTAQSPTMQTATIEEVEEVEDIIDISSEKSEDEMLVEISKTADTLPVMADVTDSSVPETPDVGLVDAESFDPFVLKAGLLELPMKKALKKALAMLAGEPMPLPVPSEEEDAAAFVPRRVPKSNKAYVLVPPPPDYVKRLKNRDTFAGEQEDEAHHMRKERALRKAVRLSCSRLRKRTCGWGGCGVEFNSGNALEEHVKLQHMGESDQSSRVYRCQWTLCGKTFDADSFDEHVLQHVTGDLYCAYEDCDQRCRQPSTLFKHHQLHEADEDRLRLPALPFTPDLPEPYGALPEILPSYMSVTRPVAREPVSPSRHSLLGPWVLWNIFGSVNHDCLIGRRPRLAVSKLKNDSSAEKAARPIVVPIVGYDEYDFLDKTSNDTPVVCDDLVDPQGVSRLLHSGVPLTINDEAGAGMDKITVNPSPPPAVEPKWESFALPTHK
ncbi:hypothetical protein EWM64_g4447 [Hericium alpestre]|uniref:C2H2-type domain-containing protein n=1 Tax=Hericium alpestre TaxID=135208 RepID=A0A4Y9ZYF3_9AGAM|nr:hypothetical protein EWM64_g4447 [Hericium alpestre]